MRPLALLAIFAALPAAAEVGGPHGMRMGPPAFLRQLFLPTVVMQHQSEIGLTDAQRKAITDDMAATEKKVLEVRWSIEQKSEALEKLLAADKVDESAVLARSGEILDLERQMKRAHLGLLVRIKNQLTPAQQTKLKELRPRFGEGRGGGGPPPDEEAP